MDRRLTRVARVLGAFIGTFAGIVAVQLMRLRRMEFLPGHPGFYVNHVVSLSDGAPIGPQAGTLLGHLFESLVTLCVRVPAQAAGATIGHLRTRNGDHEIDLVVVRDDGKALAIEVKLNAAIDDRDTTHLHWLTDQLGDALLDAVIIHTGPHAYRRPDGIAVVPLGLLAP